MLSSTSPLLLLGLFAGVVLSQQNNTTPAPLVVPVSQYMEGNDGMWSTFSLRVGNPPIEVRTLVSTQFPNTVVKDISNCEEGPNTDCADHMGEIFNQSESTSWEYQGIFNLYEELNYTTPADRGFYGFDDVGFGLNEAAGPTIRNQTVSSTRSINYYLGLLGVNPQATNFTNFQNPVPSLFTTLKDSNMIPSLSYSYTAGAVYRFRQIYGSFIFGGYDTARIELNDVDFSMAEDVTRDLVVGLQSIRMTTNDGAAREFLNDGIFTLIDTTTPYIVLPGDSFDALATAFGLTYNSTLGLWLITNGQRNSLSALQTNFTFLLGNSRSGGRTVSINVPYEAFDLEANEEYTMDGTTRRYFPFQRASNESQYTIGRAFFQEAMLIANYEHRNFSIAQAIWNEENPPPQIETIRPRGYIWPESADGNTPGSRQGASSSTGAAAIGGGVGGGIAALIVIGCLVFAFFKRKWPFHNRRPSAKELDSKQIPGAGGENGFYADEKGSMHEAPDKNGYLGSELPGKNGYYGEELEGSKGGMVLAHKELPAAPGDSLKAELAGAWRGGELDGGEAAREMHGSEFAREVDGNGIAMELPGTDVPATYLMAKQPSPKVSSRESSRRGSSIARTESPRSEQRSPLMGGSMQTARDLRGSGSSGTPGFSPLDDQRSPSNGSDVAGFLASPLSPEERDRRVNSRRVTSRGNSSRAVSNAGSEVSHDPSEGSRRPTRRAEGTNFF